MLSRAAACLAACLMVTAFEGLPPVWAAEQPAESPAAPAEPSAPSAPVEATNWTAVLRQQAISEKRCEVREILHFREFELGGDKAVEGRLTCIDGREYDFSRPRAHQPFKFIICEPTVC